MMESPERSATVVSTFLFHLCGAQISELMQRQSLAESLQPSDEVLLRDRVSIERERSGKGMKSEAPPIGQCRTPGGTAP
jgi:hypothetical protein